MNDYVETPFDPFKISNNMFHTDTNYAIQSIRYVWDLMRDFYCVTQRTYDIRIGQGIQIDDGWVRVCCEYLDKLAKPALVKYFNEINLKNNKGEPLLKYELHSAGDRKDSNDVLTDNLYTEWITADFRDFMVAIPVKQAHNFVLFYLSTSEERKEFKRQYAIQTGQLAAYDKRQIESGLMEEAYLIEAEPTVKKLVHALKEMLEIDPKEFYFKHNLENYLDKGISVLDGNSTELLMNSISDCLVEGLDIKEGYVNNLPLLDDMYFYYGNDLLDRFDDTVKSDDTLYANVTPALKDNNKFWESVMDFLNNTYYIMSPDTLATNNSGKFVMKMPDKKNEIDDVNIIIKLQKDKVTREYKATEFDFSIYSGKSYVEKSKESSKKSLDVEKPQYVKPQCVFHRKFRVCNSSYHKNCHGLAKRLVKCCEMKEKYEKKKSDINKKRGMESR